MPEYRRTRVPGGTYFSSLVTYNRRPLFASESNCKLLVTIWNDVQSRHKFKSVAACILPDHIHAIWTLPEGDDDYPMRWKEINTTSWHRTPLHKGIQAAKCGRLTAYEVTANTGGSHYLAQTVLGTYDSGPG